MIVVDDISGNNQTMTQDNKPQSKTWKYYVAIAALCLISGVIGGLIAVALVPSLYSKSSQTAQTNNSIFTPVITSTDNQPVFPVEQIAKNVGPAVVGIANLQSGNSINNNIALQEVGSGSGFIIDAQKGYIVTNNHVIDGAQKIIASLSDGRSLEVKLVGADPLTDLAVLQISDTNNLTAVNLGDSTKLIVGEPVVAIGNPGGNEFARSVTTGVVSALNRTLDIQGESSYGLIQTDAAINPGNSGGPLVDYQGLVIGITSVKFAVTGFEGMSFAIPISTALPTIQQLINTGVAKHPGLMVSVNDQYIAYAISNNLPLGAYVAAVAANGPAAKAGIKAGDVITKINGIAISNSSDLIYQIYKYQVGDNVSVTYLRNGVETQVQVKLGEISSTQ
jgi:serine protease Do